MVWEYFSWIMCWGWTLGRCVIESPRSCLARSHADGTASAGASVQLFGRGLALRQLPLGVTRHTAKLDAAHTEELQRYWLAWYDVVACQWVYSSMSVVLDAYLMMKGICHAWGRHLVEVSDDPTRGCGNRTSVRDASRCVSSKLAMAVACGGGFRRVLVVLLLYYLHHSSRH